MNTDMIKSKFDFNPIVDEHSDGFHKVYLYGESKDSKQVSYLLLIDYDMSSPRESWELIRCEKDINSGGVSKNYNKTFVYNGSKVPVHIFDELIELVINCDLEYKKLSQEEIKEFVINTKRFKNY